MRGEGANSRKALGLRIMPFGNSTATRKPMKGLKIQCFCNPKGIVSSSPATVFTLQGRILDF